jgi:hypothetical protein
MNSYLVTIFDSALLDKFGDFLNGKKEVLNWYRLVNIYAVVSESSVNDLQKLFSPYFDNNQALYLISKISGRESNGYMPENFWKFINAPKSSGYWESGKASACN